MDTESPEESLPWRVPSPRPFLPRHLHQCGHRMRETEGLQSLFAQYVFCIPMIPSSGRGPVSVRCCVPFSLCSASWGCSLSEHISSHLSPAQGPLSPLTRSSSVAQLLSQQCVAVCAQLQPWDALLAREQLAQKSVIYPLVDATPLPSTGGLPVRPLSSRRSRVPSLRSLGHVGAFILM